MRHREYDDRVTSYQHIILGGGMVAGYLAKEYVENGGKSGDLAIVSADDAFPYERPPLSKSFLAGKDSEESVLISPPEFYSSHGIEIRRNTTVEAVDACHAISIRFLSPADQFCGDHDRCATRHSPTRGCGSLTIRPASC